MSNDVMIVFVILFAAIIMFSTDRIRNDVASIIIMLSLAWSGIIPLNQAFAGFSSNAVVAIMGVMIIGFGIEKTGIMDSFANIIMQRAGTKENKVIAVVMAVAGMISSFMQNIGAVALFLPAVKKIGNKSGISNQRLIMPLAFAGILGGTITMVASGPLIILNDLLNKGGYDSFGLFSVTPIGLGVLFAGILYFYLLSGKVLPGGGEKSQERKDELLDIYNLPREIHEVVIEKDCELIGKTIEELDIWRIYGIHILALWDSGSKTFIPWRKTTFKEGQILAIFGEDEHLSQFFKAFNLEHKHELVVFRELADEKEAGFAEIILPPDSNLKGKTLEEIALRKNYRIEPIIYINTDGNRLNLMDWEMEPGLKVIVFGRWEDLNSLKKSKDFVVSSSHKTPKPLSLSFTFKVSKTSS